MATLQNIAIVGATGHVGKFITDALVAGRKHTITAITRADSSANLSPGVIRKVVNYDDKTSLVDALKGQDALVITMAAMAPPGQQTKLIEAAAEASVPWILPNEWGSDTSHPAILRNPANESKAKFREEIDKLGNSNWIAIVNNQWWEWSLGGGSYGIDIKNRKAKFWNEGTDKTVTTTWPRVGEAVARLLALPISGTSPCLEDFRNKHVYISSFYLTQREMLDAVQRNTGTTDKDWEITREPVVPAYEKALEEFKQGNFRALVTVIYGGNFMPDGGNDYIHTKKTLNKLLDLPDEDLDQATKRAIEYSKIHKPYF